MPASAAFKIANLVHPRQEGKNPVLKGTLYTPGLLTTKYVPSLYQGRTNFAELRRKYGEGTEEIRRRYNPNKKRLAGSGQARTVNGRPAVVALSCRFFTFFYACLFSNIRLHSFI